MPAAPEKAAPPSTHGEALKSTSIIGGSTAVTMVIKMVRTKALAMLLGPLGPAGVGLEGTFDSIINVARNVANLVSASGVRQIAVSGGSGDETVIASTVLTLRRVCRVLGTASAIAIFLLRKPLSVFTFKSDDHARDIGILSIILLLTAVNGSQGALLQGMRRIGALAKMNIIGAAVSTAITIPVVWIWGLKGIPYYMVLQMAVVVIISWFYVRKVSIKPVKVLWRQTIQEARGLMSLGLVLTASGVLSTVTLYLLNVIVARRAGVDGVGQFQAATKLSQVYVLFVLQAMQTDFFPRVAGAKDSASANGMVNDQVEVSLVLLLPGILATLAFAPWLLPIFYSNRFDVATQILCWQMGGMLLQVITWPLGTSLVAKGMGRVFLWTQVFASISYPVCTWLGLKFYGLPGTGMGFLASYLCYLVVISAVTRHVLRFEWSSINLRLIAMGAITIGIALVAHFTLSPLLAMLVGAVIATAVGIYCLRLLIKLVGRDKIARWMRKFKLPFSEPKQSSVGELPGE